MTNRATGRTFRELLKAIHDASDGETVIYLTLSVPEKMIYFNMVNNITTNLAGIRFDKVGSDYHLKFPNDGILVIKAINDQINWNLHDLKPILYIDHWIHENMHMDIMKQLDEWQQFVNYRVR